MARNMEYREENKRLQSEIDFRLMGVRMREVRLKSGLTQKALAEQMGLDTNYYGTLETGANRISMSRFIQFLGITKASADYLLTGVHADITGDDERLSGACEERRLLEGLLDHCANDTIRTIYAMAKALYDASK